MGLDCPSGRAALAEHRLTHLPDAGRLPPVGSRLVSCPPLIDGSRPAAPADRRTEQLLKNASYRETGIEPNGVLASLIGTYGCGRP